MEKEGMDVLQVLLKDFRLKEAVDTKFLGNLQKEFENAKIVSMIIAFDDENSKEGAINLIHVNTDYEKEKKLIIDTTNTKHLDKIISVIEKQKGD